MFGFFKRKRANRMLIEAIYAALVERARDPVLFTDYGIDDNFEGRFEALTLFTVLVTRRLKSMPAPAAELAQDAIDHVFAQFDRALREAGVGDLTVPKRMKTMASAFMGRASAYDQALIASDLTAFAETIERNVYGGRSEKTGQAKRLAAFAMQFDRAIMSAGIATLVDAIKSAPNAASTN